MKKVLSLVLALVMILSIGTVGVSAAAEDYIWIYASTQHARIGDYVYYPVYYEAPISYGSFVNYDSEAETNAIFSFSFDPDVLKPIEVTPSELLYGMDFEGDIVEVVEDFVWTAPEGYSGTWSYFNASVKFKGYEGIEDGAILFNVKLEVIKDEFYNTNGKPKNVFDSDLYKVGDDISNWKNCVWDVTDSSGNVSDFSKKVEYNYRASFADAVLEGYEPFIPPVEEDVPPSKFDDISVDADVFHARIGDYAYFPLAYDCDTAYKYYVGSDENSKTKIIFPFLYMPDLLEPVEAIPSELLYNMGGTVKITEYGSYVQSNGSAIDYLFVEVNFDGYEGIVDDTILFNVKCKVLSEEFFDEYDTYKIGIFDNFHMVENGSVNFSKNCTWEIAMSDGANKDISSNMQPPMLLFYDEYDSYDDFVLNDYEPFIPPVDEDSKQLKVGESVQMSLATDEVVQYSFIPEQSGTYKVSVAGGMRSLVEAEIYRADSPENILDKGITMTTDVTGYVGVIKPQMVMSMLKTSETSLVYMNARANDEIIIELRDGTSEARELEKEFTVLKGITECFIPSVVTVTVEATELTTILPDEKHTVSSKEVFEFIPEKTGNYRFTSELADGAAPEIKICDYAGVVASSTDFETLSVSNSLDFDVIAELQAGESYLVHCNNTAVNNDNQSIGTFSVKVEDMNVEADITNVTYIQQEDTHKDFTVTVNGRKQMIQFMEPDGGTRTYDRYHKNVKITSYNSDGEVVNSMARDLAYEVWEIYSNMSVGNEIKVRGKENGKWDAEKYSFIIEPYNPIISMELSSTSGKKGPVPATVVADEKTEKVMFKMPDNTTVTVASKSTDENGNKIFTGNAWMNEDGLNEIRIFIYRNNVWRQVGTLEYEVE